MAVESPSAPSLDLAFEWLKPVIRDQIQRSEILDQKASVMFALTTAMVAGGVSFGVGDLSGSSIAAFTFAGLGLLFYCLAVVAFRSCTRTHQYRSLNDPSVIRIEWLDLEPEDFKHYMLGYTEAYHRRNRAMVDSKLKPLELLQWLVILEMCCLIPFLVLAKLGF